MLGSDNYSRRFNCVDIFTGHVYSGPQTHGNKHQLALTIGEVSFDTMLRNQFNQKLKLMVKVLGYVIYFNITNQTL